MTRQSRTPADRAQAALDVATRRLDKTKTKRNALRRDMQTAEAAVSQAEVDLAYLAKSPHLKQPVGDKPVAPTVHSTGRTDGAKMIYRQQGEAGPS